jgi:predicted adenylyl cyclase CyaB
MSRLAGGETNWRRVRIDRQMRNLEAKFRLSDHAGARERALAIGFGPRGILIQRDTFFTIPNGKLKLREQDDGAWLIHYRRNDQRELQLSNYSIVAVNDPGAMRAMLAEALGVLAEVRKHRTLMMRRNVRLHLDRVEGLGDFGEIEAVLAEGDSPLAFHQEVNEIFTGLGIAENALINRSYFELMQSGSSAS